MHGAYNIKLNGFIFMLKGEAVLLFTMKAL
jgi:hypothetical protein